MELSGKFFDQTWLIGFAALYLAALWRAVRWADWSRLRSTGQQHAYLGALVFLFLLWNLRVELEPGFFWHISGLLTLTLMFGWSLALIGGSLALFGVTLAGFNDWDGYLPSAVLYVLMPVTLTQVALGLSRAYLPRHFFVFVLVNAFLTGGLVFLVMALSTLGLLTLLDAYPAQDLQRSFVVMLPLMVFPESTLNGWLVAAIVVFKPGWMGSFRDEEYLKDK